MIEPTIRRYGAPRSAVVMVLAITSSLSMTGCEMVSFPCPGEGGPPVSLLSTEERQAKLETVAAEIREQFDLPGLSLAIADCRDDVIAATAGVRQIGAPDLMTTDDLIHLGSVTKCITSMIIARLVEQGAVSWDSTLSELLPTPAQDMHPDFRNVTLRQVLEHRAGLQPFTSGAEFQALPTFDGTAQEQRAAWVVWLLSRPPTSTVGEHVYSNASHTVGAVISETATGQSWETLLDEQLARPLGIGMTLGWPGESGDPGAQPWGHFWDAADGWSPVDPAGEYQPSVLVQPAGDVSMTMTELAVLMREHLCALACQPITLELSRERFLELHTAPANIEEPSRGSFWIVPQPPATYSFMDGSDGTFLCVCLISHGGEFALIVGTNGGRSTIAEIDQLASELATAVVTRAGEEQVIAQ